MAMFHPRSFVPLLVPYDFQGSWMYWRQLLWLRQGDFGPDVNKKCRPALGFRTAFNGFGVGFAAPILEFGEYSLHLFLFLLGQEGVHQDSAGMFIGDDLLSGGDLHLYLWGDGEEGSSRGPAFHGNHGQTVLNVDPDPFVGLYQS